MKINLEEQYELREELARIKTILVNYHTGQIKYKKPTLTMLYRQLMKMRLSDPLPDIAEIIPVVAPAWNYHWSKKAGLATDLSATARTILLALQKTFEK